ncbi:MAG: TolC family protein [Rikenellaceae bacterium]
MNNLKNIVVATLLCSSVSGCGLYSKYERPTDELVVVDSLYEYIEATDELSSIATISWRDFFVDPYLQSLIELGIENNSDLNIARLSVDQAAAALRSAKLAYLPSLSLTPNVGITTLNGATTRSYDLSASASWEIDLFGKLTNAKEQSKAALEQSVAYRQAVQTELISTIANSYYTLLMLDEQLRISESTVLNWEKNTKAIEALKKAGRVNVTSVLQSEANRVALSSSIVSIKQQIMQMESSLSTLLAIAPQRIERGSITETRFSTELSVGVPLELLSNRPDVKVAEYNLMGAFYTTNEARSSLYPSITLSGSAGYKGSGGVIPTPGEMIYSAAASLVQPIFSRGTLRAQLTISKSQQEQALIQFKQAILDAGDEVNSALIQWQSATERLTCDKEHIALLEQAVRSQELLMKHGNVNYLEVLTAQISLLQGELTYASDKFDEIQGVVYLYRALGGGSEM